MKKLSLIILGLLGIAVPVAWYLNDYSTEDIIALFNQNDQAIDLINRDINQKPSAAGQTLDTSCEVPVPASNVVVNVRDFGAAGNGINNDTAAIQAAIDRVTGTGGTVLVPSGTYMIDAVTKLRLGSNMTFEMKGATLQAIPNNATNYSIIFMNNVSDVNVIGGTLIGERANHLGTEGEWGMGIAVMSSQNVVIHSVISKDAWGDGFYVGRSDNNPISSNVKVCSVVADNNRRQGISIVAVDSMLVNNSTFSNTNGAPPMAGIDIEPDLGDNVNNVIIMNSQMFNNKGTGITATVPLDYAPSGNKMITNVIIKNNIVTNNSSEDTSAQGILISNSSGNQIINNIVDHNRQDGIAIVNGAANNIITGNISTNNGTIKKPANGIGILVYYTHSVNNIVTGNIVTGNTKASIMDIDTDGRNLIQDNNEK